MQIYSIADKIALYLASALREQGCTPVTGVRIKDIRLNGVPFQSENFAQLLVCRGDRILLGVACCQEEAVLFNADMQGLPYVQLPEVDSALPLSQEDEGWLDFPSEACLERLLAQVMRLLSPPQGKSLASYRKQATQENKKRYTLPAILPEGISLRRMVETHLLREDFTPTAYGAAHGLFLLYGTESGGTPFRELLTVPEAVKDIRAILNWKPAKTSHRRSLAERRKQACFQQEMGNVDTAAAIRNLLNTPVDALFQNRDKELRQLMSTLSFSRFLLKGKRRETTPTCKEVLQTIHQLRQGFADDPRLDDEHCRHMRKSCETLLLLLGEVFLNPPQGEIPVQSSAGSRKRLSLRRRLAHLRGQPLSQLFLVPLVEYYRALSRLWGCDYPNWVYRTRIRVIFQHREKPETAFTPRFLAAYAKVCREDEGVDDWAETFPLLYDLVVLPLFADV